MKIAPFKLIRSVTTRILSPLLKQSLDEDSKNIERWRQRKALSETGDFVEHHMPMVRSFPDKFGLLRYAISQLIDDEDGLVCEFGVYRGTTVNFIADLLPNVPVYGFDAFEGLPEDWRDGTVRGHFSLTELPEVRPNVQLFKGLFSDSLGPFLEAHAGRALLLHIDSDLYSSARTVLEEFERRIQQGTVLVFDEVL